jgi:hypothetical protein
MAVGALSNSQAQALFKEKYRDVVPALFEAEMNVCSVIEKRDTEKIGKRGLIIAKKMRPGGQVRTFDPDGGDLGRGTGAQYEKATITPIPLLVALEATRAAQWNTQSNDIAIKSAVKDQLKDGTTEFKAMLDRYLMGSGDGVMAEVVSGSGASYVMKAPIGTRWLRAGHRYTVYPTALGGPKGTVVIDQIDHPNKTVTLTASTAIIASTDKFLPDGVVGPTPTWFNGFRYHFSSANTGLWLGMDRSVWPQIRSREVVAGGGALVATHVRALKNQMQLNRDGCFKKGRWQIVWNPTQAQAYEELALLVNQYPKNQPSRTGVEVLYNPEEFSVDGFNSLTTSNQNPTVIDLTNWDNWFRVETIPFGLYTVDDVSTFPIYGASGGLSATDVTYLASIMQYCVDDPGLGGIISGLAVPANYPDFV